MPQGVVKFYKDKGWGAISSTELPEGHDAFVICSAIEGDWNRGLQEVEFDYVAARQDSFDFVATRVRRISSS